jgi:hypothetical protein
VFRRNHVREESHAGPVPMRLPTWNAHAVRADWIRQAIETLRTLEGLDRIAVWLEPELSEQDSSSPVVFIGDVWESDGGQSPAEWTRLSADAPLPRGIFERGKAVESQLPELTGSPMLGVLLGLRRALWVPISGRQLVRGLLLVGTRDKERSLPILFVEQIAAQLALFLEFEAERRVSHQRKDDLELSRIVQSPLASGQTPRCILNALVESCTKSQKAGGVGAVFALIGEQQSGLPVTQPSAASHEERLRVMAESAGGGHRQRGASR